MNGSAGTRALAPSARANTFAVPPVGQLWRWLLALPEGLGVSTLVVFGFAAIALIISTVYGAPLTIPRERVSMALGFSAVFPVAAAISIYFALRIVKAVLKRPSLGHPPLFQMIATDVSYMCLFLTATYFHFSLKTWVQVINPNLYDDYYILVDRSLQPVIDLFFWIRTTYFTAVANTDAWYQAAFLLMFISGFCTLAVTRSAIYPRFCFAVLLTMSLGALSYLIAPALGPFIYEQGLNERATIAQAGMLRAHQQVLQEGMSWIRNAGPGYFTGALAAMPSLHIAHAIVMTWFMIKARSLLTPFFLAICIWVLIESVASRWHYLIDLPAGALLAVFIIWVTHRLVPIALPRRAVWRHRIRTT